MRRWMYVLIALLLAAASCGLFENKKDAEPPPGRRDYTWTVDSVYSAPNGWIYDIWGAKPNDVWAVSPGGAYHLWHYDGKSWSPDSNRNLYGLESIYGFSSDDIWAGGGGGRLYHYDGKTWSLSYSYTIKGMGEPTIKDIWGNSPSNIYVTGVALPDKGLPFKSFLLYYNGKQWKEVLVTDFGVQFLRVRSDRSGVYLGGRIVDQGAPDTLVFYRYRGDRLKELLATTKEIRMNTINGSLFFLVNDTLYHSSPDILRDGIPLPTQNVVYDLNGRSADDLFLTSAEGLVHYNGVNMQYLFHIDHPFDYFSSDGLMLKRDVFFVTNDFQAGTNLIYHGVLPQEEKESMP